MGGGKKMIGEGEGVWVWGCYVYRSQWKTDRAPRLNGVTDFAQKTD